MSKNTIQESKGLLLKSGNINSENLQGLRRDVRCFIKELAVSFEKVAEEYERD